MLKENMEGSAPSLRVQRILQIYRMYCFANLAFYGVLVIIAVLGLFSAKAISADPPAEMSPDLPQQIRAMSFLLLGIAGLFGILAVKVLKMGRSLTSYSVHMTNIAAGITTICLAPFCIWLLIQWMSPEVRAHFETQADPKFEL